MTKSAAFALGGAHAGRVYNRSDAEEPSPEKVKVNRGKIKYRRRTIELHPDMDAMLHSMQDDLRLKTQTEVMQKAIQLLSFVLGKEDGRKKRVYIEKENGNLQELIIL